MTNYPSVNFQKISLWVYRSMPLQQKKKSDFKNQKKEREKPYYNGVLQIPMLSIDVNCEVS